MRTTIVTEIPVTSIIVERAMGPQGPPGPGGPGVEDIIRNLSPSGGFRITNMRMDENLRVVITYEDTPVA
jgi:hypothetical protein